MKNGLILTQYMEEKPTSTNDDRETERERERERA
jgi:hypothetical protein